MLGNFQNVFASLTAYGIGQNLNVFLTDLGNRAPDVVQSYALIGGIIFIGTMANLVRKQAKARKFLYGSATLAVCVFVNPVWFLPYAEFYQTVFLLIVVPIALVELRLRKMLTIVDIALFNVPLWHWSLIYWVGCLNAA